MAIMIPDLDEVQIGIESTAGTLVAATRQIPFLDGTSFEPTIERQTLAEVRGVTADYDDIIVGRMSSLNLNQSLDYEHLLAAFNCGFDVAAVSGSDPYTWAYTPTSVGYEPTDTATIEVALTDGAAVNPATYRRRFGFARPTSINIDVSDQTAQLSTVWMGRAAQTLTTPANVSSIPRTVVPARLAQVFLDDNWGSLGSSAANGVRSVSLAYTTGQVPGYRLAGRSDLDQVVWDRSPLRGTVTLDIDLDATGAAEIADWVAGNLRFIRVQIRLSANRQIQLDHACRYIETPNPLNNADEGQHSVQLVGHLRVDGTGAQNRFAASVTNSVASW